MSRVNGGSTYSVTNHEIFAFDCTLGRPWSGRSRFDILWRLSFEVSVFFDAFQSNLMEYWYQICNKQKKTGWPWTAQVLQIFAPEWCHIQQQHCFNQAARTIKRRSPVIVEENASANPAMDAVILGVIKQTRPVAPTIPAESKLKRTESQRFTTAKDKQWRRCKNRGCFTSPHPVVRIRVLLRVFE